MSKQTKKLTVRNSTAEFLIFTQQSGEEGIEAHYEHDTIWLTQKLMAKLFSAERSVITKHLKNLFDDRELDQNSVCAKFAHTAVNDKTYNEDYFERLLEEIREIHLSEKRFYQKVTDIYATSVDYNKRDPNNPGGFLLRFRTSYIMAFMGRQPPN